MNIAVDLHMHSCLSPCGDELMTPNNIVNMALIKGLDIIAVCDHNTARHLPANRPEFFGEQTLLDSEDEPVGTEPRLLLTALDLTIGQLTRDINAAGGLAVPAHINRGANGLLVNLGMLPPDEHFAALEVSNAVPAPDCDTGAYKLLYSSDAHCLENIAEREYFLNVPECSSKGLFEYLCACRERVWSANFC